MLALKEAMSAAAAAVAAAGMASEDRAGTSVSANASGSAGGHTTAAAAAAAAMPPLVQARHFEAALRGVAPSVSRRDRRAYEAMRVRLRGARAHLPATSAGDGVADADGGQQDQQEQQQQQQQLLLQAGSRMDAAPQRRSGAGEDMEGTDDAPEPEDPMND